MTIACLLAKISNAQPAMDYDLEPMWRRAEDGKRRDIFMSRGWGAGGMPFNVLYTQMPKITRATPMKPLAPITPLAVTDEGTYVAEPQALRSLRQEPLPYRFSPARRQYSVIPQLFVSYGWGPIGRK